VGTEQELSTIKSSTGWFNICSMLETDPPRNIYPRGLPYSHRWENEDVLTTGTGKSHIAMNAGLWLEDPDVDAVTRLNEQVRVTALNKQRIMMDNGTWAPINTQNTAFSRDVLPCFYYVVMGEPIQGMYIDRYGDIWAGYLARKVIDGIGDSVTYGTPMAIHRRNSHNLLKDLREEIWGMILTEDFINVLRSVDIKFRGR
jgi:hypothetical protein